MSQEELPKIDNEAISNTDGSVDQSPSAPNTESEKTSTVEEQVENTDPIAAEATPAETTVEEDTKDNDIKGGAVLIGVGVGVVLIGALGLNSAVVWTAGLLVMSLGLALLGFGIYNAKQARNDAS